MALSKKQRKQIKLKIKTASLEEVAKELNLKPKEIEKYLKKIWRKEKYQKIVSQKKSVGILKTKTDKHSPEKVGLEELFQNNWKILTFLAFLVLAVYINSLGHDFVSDDIGTIRDNPLIGQFEYLKYFNFNLRSIIIYLTHQAVGLKPLFYRLSNIFFHLGSTWIIYSLMAVFFSSPIPLIVASLFATHPILVESVTWISGGAYSNPTFFALASFLTYLWSKKNRKYYWLSLILFFLALAGSQKLIVFFLFLPLYDFLFEKLEDNWRKLIPFALITFFWLLPLFAAWKNRVAILETQHYSKPTLTNPFLQIPIAITKYFELIVWPKNLTLYHSEMAFSQFEYFLRLGFLFLILISFIYFFKKDRRLFFWLAFFFVSLSPTLTPLGVSWIVAERYVYPAALGIFVLIAFLIQKISQISQKKETACVFLGIILTLLSVRTIIRNNDWKNQDTLWLAAAKTSPSSPQNHNNLGDYYGRQGDFERAVEEFQKAIELKPNYGDAYHNLANVYHRMEKNDLAIENYQKAISFNPKLWQSYQNLASVHFSQENYELARQELEKAIKINPQNINLYVNLGVVYLKLNQSPKAREILQQALKLDPENQNAQQLILSLLENDRK